MCSCYVMLVFCNQRSNIDNNKDSNIDNKNKNENTNQ